MREGATEGLNALVLAGGAARGAYEVGVLDYVLGDVARAIGRPPVVHILCGTSVGAINACVVAAHMTTPEVCRRVLTSEWQGLRLEEIVRANTAELVRLFGSLAGKMGVPATPARRGGFLDPRGIEGVVERAIPFSQVGENLAQGRLKALTLSTTHLASGKTVIFVEHAAGMSPRWSKDPTIAVEVTDLRAEHALASAALPLMFPAVHISGEYFCDGGLRQNVPLSPARRLGASGLIVVNPRFVAPSPEPPRLDPMSRARPSVVPSSDGSVPSPLFVLGKALNALLLDRIDNDLDRLRRINAILDAGTRRFGPSFVEAVNHELGHDVAASGVRSLDVVHVRASENIGKLAADYVASTEFQRRAPGVIGKLLRRIAEWDSRGDADLLSYLLFDGAFAARLIDLGRRDARARHEELCAFFTRRR
jgi:NTE family protein